MINNINNVINEILIKYGLTQKQLSQKVYISQRQLIRIKKGESRPGNKFITGLKNAFPEIDLNELIENIK